MKTPRVPRGKKPPKPKPPPAPRMFGERGWKLKPEEAVQIAIVDWVAAVAPNVHTVAIPNEGERSSATKITLKRKGMWAGAPDLMFLKKPGCVAFAEVKQLGGKLEDHQRVAIQWLEQLRFPVAVLRSIDDARHYFRLLGWPTRESQQSTQRELFSVEEPPA